MPVSRTVDISKVHSFLFYSIDPAPDPPNLPELITASPLIELEAHRRTTAPGSSTCEPNELNEYKEANERTELEEPSEHKEGNEHTEHEEHIKHMEHNEANEHMEHNKTNEHMEHNEANEYIEHMDHNEANEHMDHNEANEHNEPNEHTENIEHNKPYGYCLLGMSAYLEKWWSENEARCKSRRVGFASCYQQSLGITQLSCDTTGPSQCDFPISFATGGYTARQAYALYSIFGIWQWFESIYEAVLNADVTASGPIGSIIRTINPKKKEQHLLANFLSAMSVIAPCFNFPASLGTWGIFKISTVLEGVVRQAPGIVEKLYPVGTLDSQFVGLTDLSEGLSIVKSTYQQNVSDALKLVQNNFTNFNIFTANGSFIAPKSDLHAQTVNLTMSLQTYVVSQALTQSNYIITMARDTNPQQLATNGSLGTPELMDCRSYDEYGLCGEWWWDSSTNIAYSVSDISEPGKKNHDMLAKVFAKRWTTPELLFRGAKTCADYVAGGHGPNTPTLDVTSFQPRCISNTQVCVYKPSCAINDRNCLYTQEYGGGPLCKAPRNFLDAGCDGNSAGAFMTFNVPAAYLGPLSFDYQFNHIVCIG
ncbi:MAG: hypothetical protein Q9163_005071 [Psora crenata]